jgi:predicted NUDIX family phosphoesterase
VQILCVKTNSLPLEWTQKTRALCADVFSHVRDADIHWIERGHAENDETYRQIIPYIVIMDTAGKFLCYPRHGNEARLHGFYSCGIGGHIDIPDKHETFSQTVYAGLARELSEELANFSQDSLLLEYRGIINDIDSPVSRVHFGLVFLGRCAEGYLPAPSAELSGARWLSRKELEGQKKEAWSKLALELI